MNVDEFGKSIGRSGKTISAWEAGRNVPSTDMLVAICRRFEIRIDYFFPQDVIAPSTNSSFTPNEIELVSLFRQLESNDQSIITAMAKALIRKDKVP